MKSRNILQLLGAWLRSRRQAIVLILTLDLCLFAVYGLNQTLRWGGALYAALISLAVAAVFAVADFVRFTARYNTLQRLAGRFPTGQLPQSEDAVEQEYHAIIAALEAERARLEGELQRRQRDNEQYYQLWVHQIKTPIAASRLLLQKPGGLPPDMLRSRLSGELYRIEQYTDMALQYQRLASFSGDLLLQTHTLHNLVHKALKSSMPLFLPGNVRVCPGPIEGEVVTDEKWFCFVLEQLLSNAAKYTREGEVRIYTEGDTLVVEDTGIGIAPEDVPRVFERGYTGRAGRMDTRATGIGLYLCREAAQRLGFSIALTSVPGKGTAVRLHLAQTRPELD